MGYYNNLKKMREAQNLSQTQISKMAGIGLRTYQRYESGERLPDVITGLKIAKALDVDLKDIYTPLL